VAIVRANESAALVFLAEPYAADLRQLPPGRRTGFAPAPPPAAAVTSPVDPLRRRSPPGRNLLT